MAAAITTRSGREITLSSRKGESGHDLADTDWAELFARLTVKTGHEQTIAATLPHLGNVACIPHGTRTKRAVVRPEWHRMGPIPQPVSILEALRLHSQVCTPSAIISVPASVAMGPGLIDSYGSLRNQREYDSLLLPAKLQAAVKARRSTMPAMKAFISGNFPNHKLHKVNLKLSAFRELAHAAGLSVEGVADTMHLQDCIGLIQMMLMHPQRAPHVTLSDSSMFKAKICGDDPLQFEPATMPTPEGSEWVPEPDARLLKGLSQTNREWLAACASSATMKPLHGDALPRDKLTHALHSAVHQRSQRDCERRFQDSSCASFMLCIHTDGVAVSQYNRSETPIYISHTHCCTCRHVMMLIGWKPHLAMQHKNPRVLREIRAAYDMAIMQAVYDHLAVILGVPIVVATSGRVQKVVPYLYMICADMLEKWKLNNITNNWCYLCTTPPKGDGRFDVGIPRDSLCHDCGVPGVKSPDPSVWQRQGYSFHILAPDYLHELPLGLVKKFVGYLISYAKSLNTMTTVDAVWAAALQTIPALAKSTNSVLQGGNGTLLRGYEWVFVAPALPKIVKHDFTDMLGERAGYIFVTATLLANVVLSVENTVHWTKPNLIKLHERVHGACMCFSHCFRGVKLKVNKGKGAASKRSRAHQHNTNAATGAGSSEAGGASAATGAATGAASRASRATRADRARVSATTGAATGAASAANVIVGTKRGRPKHACVFIAASRAAESMVSDVESSKTSATGHSSCNDTTSEVDSVITEGGATDSEHTPADHEADLVMFAKLHAVKDHMVPGIVLLGPPQTTSSTSLEAAHSEQAKPAFDATSRRQDCEEEVMNVNLITSFYRDVVAGRSLLLTASPPVSVGIEIIAAVSAAIRQVCAVAGYGLTSSGAQAVGSGSRNRLLVADREGGKLYPYEVIKQKAMNVGYAALPTTSMTAATARTAITILADIVRAAVNDIGRRSTPCDEKAVQSYITEGIRAVELRLQYASGLSPALSTQGSQNGRQLVRHGPWRNSTANQLCLSTSVKWIIDHQQALCRHLKRYFKSELAASTWRWCERVTNSRSIVVSAAPVYRKGAVRTRRSILDRVVWCKQQDSEELKPLLCVAVYVGQSLSKVAPVTQAAAALCVQLLRKQREGTCSRYDMMYDGSSSLTIVPVEQIIVCTGCLVSGQPSAMAGMASVRQQASGPTARYLLLMDPPCRKQTFPISASHRQTIVSSDIWAVLAQIVDSDDDAA